MTDTADGFMRTGAQQCDLGQQSRAAACSLSGAHLPDWRTVAGLHALVVRNGHHPARDQCRLALAL